MVFFPKLIKIVAPLCIVIVAAIFLFQGWQRTPNRIEMPPAIPGISDIQILSPFSELTIPSLRKRNYQSQLGELEKVASNSQYTSNVTTYQSDGLTIHGLLTVPTGTPPEGGWPAIVFVHGYIPPATYKTQEKYVAYVDYLARNGFVVFKIDLRGHGISEGSPSGAYYSPNYVIDTLNAYAALQSTSYINSKKIGLWGHSMAGNVVMRSMVVKPEIPATVIWAGAGYSYEDLQKYRIHDLSYRPPASASPIATTSAMDIRSRFPLSDEFWKQVAPVYFLRDVRGSIQLHHAKNDDVVSIQYSRDLNEKLNETTIPHELFEYETGGHNISGSNFNVAMKRTVEFFNFHLKN